MDPRRVNAESRHDPADRLAALYARQGAATLRMAYLLTGNFHEAQDVSHEAFLRVGRKLFRIRDQQHENAYLYRTVLNLCRGRARRRKVEQRALGKLEYLGRPRDTEIQVDDLWKTLTTLPLRQRSALYFRYYLDLSEADAADAIGCSVSALKSLVNRGLTQLRRQLQGDTRD